MSQPVFFRFIDNRLKNDECSQKYLHFTYYIHLITGFVGIILFWIIGVTNSLLFSAIVYWVVIVVITTFYWNTRLTKWNLFPVSILFGFILFYRTVNELVEITPLWPGLFTGIISSLLISLLIMLVLNTYYSKNSVNSASLTERLLKKTFILIALRAIWQVVILFDLSVATQYGETLNALTFFWTAEPTRLVILLIVGIFIPVMYVLPYRKGVFENGSWRVKVLFLVLLSSVLIAEFYNKYFLLQFGIVL